MPVLGEAQPRQGAPRPAAILTCPLPYPINRYNPGAPNIPRATAAGGSDDTLHVRAPARPSTQTCDPARDTR